MNENNFEDYLKQIENNLNIKPTSKEDNKLTIENKQLFDNFLSYYNSSQYS